MYWFWYFLFASQPALLLLGLFGVLGKEAEKAASDLSLIYGILAVVVLVLVVLYFLIHGIATALGLSMVLTTLI